MIKLKNENVRKLLQIIGSPYLDEQIIQPEESEDFFHLAHQNRIALLYLQRLQESNKLNILQPHYEKNVKRLCQLYSDIRRLVPVLDKLNISYVLVKTLRSYPETPNDIDLLILDDFEPRLGELVSALESLGYRKYIKNNNRYNFCRLGKIGFWDYKRVGPRPISNDPSLFLDLDVYGELMVEELVHGDKTIFYPDIVENTFTNYLDASLVRSKVLSPAANLFYVYFHSIFPTRNLGLEVFYTTLFDLLHLQESDYVRFAELAKRTRLKKEIIYSLSLVRDLYYLVFSQRCETLEILWNSVYRKGKIFDSSNDKAVTFPHIFPISYFLLAGIKSSFHKKGLQSIMAIILKSFYPPYAINLIREVFSKKLAKSRYSLKFDIDV